MSGKPNDSSISAPANQQVRTLAELDRAAAADEPKPRLAAALKRAARLGPRFKTKEELFDALDKAREG